MQFLVLMSAVALATASHHHGGFYDDGLVPYVVNPGGIGGIYKGPDSATIIKGPDGAIIKSKHTPGKVIVGETQAGVIHTSGVSTGTIHAGGVSDGSINVAPSGSSYVAIDGPGGEHGFDIGLEHGLGLVDTGVLSVGEVHVGPVSTGAIHAGGASAGSIHAGGSSAGLIHASGASAGSIHAGGKSAGIIHAGAASTGSIHAGLGAPGVIQVDGHGGHLDGEFNLDPSLLHVSPVSGGSIHVDGASVGSIHETGVSPGVIHASGVSAGSINVGPSPGGVLHVDTPVPLPTPIHSSVILRQDPIIVPDIVVTHNPKIVEEKVIVGHKIISVPKKVEEDSDLVGPSGTISIRGGDAVVSGPASITIKGDGVITEVEKQPEVTIKTAEIKPVIPAVVTKVATPIVAPLILPTVHPVVESAGTIITKKIYAPKAPLLDVHPVVSSVEHRGIIGLNHAGHAHFAPAPVLVNPLPLAVASLHLPHYAPAYVPHPHVF